MGQLKKNALEKLMHKINALSSANVRVQGFPWSLGTSTKRECHGILIHPIDSHSWSVINATFVVQMGSAADVSMCTMTGSGKAECDAWFLREACGKGFRLRSWGFALRTRLDVVSNSSHLLNGNSPVLCRALVEIVLLVPFVGDRGKLEIN